MSSVTTSCIDAYKEGVDRTCDSVDGSIKVTTKLINVNLQQMNVY